MLDQYQRRCTTSVSQDEIYQSLESAGLELGPKFRIIQDAQLGDGEVIAHVDCSHGDRQSIVTTMLSACFHALIFPMSSS
ncbi:polyketide synthase dehydratase domain-containing protein, partial [Salmonella sp. s55004]|uniref:polyketide synthase dehydratase domain-containing protein n=1 Tax=Salmonella sp. s55004 TaxID=3159675 RepID=UPI003980B9C7